MCAYGVFGANEWGFRSLAVTGGVALCAGVLAQVYAFDARVRALDLARPLAAMTLAMFPLSVFDLALRDGVPRQARPHRRGLVLLGAARPRRRRRRGLRLGPARARDRARRDRHGRLDRRRRSSPRAHRRKARITAAGVVTLVVAPRGARGVGPRGGAARVRGAPSRLPVLPPPQRRPRDRLSALRRALPRDDLGRRRRRERAPRARRGGSRGARAVRARSAPTRRARVGARARHRRRFRSRASPWSAAALRSSMARDDELAASSSIALAGARRSSLLAGERLHARRTRAASTAACASIRRARGAPSWSVTTARSRRSTRRAARSRRGARERRPRRRFACRSTTTAQTRDGSEVRFVIGGDVVGPMGPDLVPVDPPRSSKFIQDHGADRALELEEITPAGAREHRREVALNIARSALG